MKLFTITKWEFRDSILSRKFVMIFFLQLSVLVLMIISFNSFAASVESQKGLSLTPSLTDFSTLDVEDVGGLFKKRINPDLIKVVPSTYIKSMTRLDKGQTTGFYSVSPDSIERIRIGEKVDTVLYLDYSDPKSIVVQDAINTTTQIMSTSLTESYLQSVNPQNTSSQTGINEENTGEALPLQLVHKMILAVLLFLPLFLFGNMVVDSVVGEKERKTGEILVAMPITHGEIILGKALAVVGITSLQVALWIIILLGAGFTLENVILVYLMVVFTSVPIVGLTTLIAAYAKNYKEAGIGISFVYILVVGSLIVPALAYISRKTTAANISPMTIVIRLFSGENIAIGEVLLSISFMVLVSGITFYLATWLFRRDDILFGPRPGPLKLLLQLISGRR
jgi:ABC-2 type transport system permease protein